MKKMEVSICISEIFLNATHYSFVVNTNMKRLQHFTVTNAKQYVPFSPGAGRLGCSNVKILHDV